MAPAFVIYPGLTALLCGSDDSSDHTPDATAPVEEPSEDDWWVALVILDIPLSFALDTALLPIDLLTWPLRRKPEKEDDR